MANPPYLAMTAAEFSCCNDLPPRLAWMACHFSVYGRGISNVPRALPKGSMLILNDRIEPVGIDPELVARQLHDVVENLECGGLLLDFQRPGSDLTAAVATAICDSPPCPVAVSSWYSADLNCAVFLPPPSLRQNPDAYFVPWSNREVWLEVYDQWETADVREDGVQFDTQPLSVHNELPHFDTELNCRYGLQIRKDHALFTLRRGMEQWETTKYPITNLVALWQDYRI
jgi:hypothetical protein